MSTILIGIAGGTGSGKTTLTRHLKEHFGPEVTVIGSCARWYACSLQVSSKSFLSSSHTFTGNLMASFSYITNISCTSFHFLSWLYLSLIFHFYHLKKGANPL